MQINTDIIIGGYTKYLYKCNGKTNKLQNIHSEVNPSYAYNFNNYIYAISQIDQGMIDVLNPQFQLLKRVDSKGANPCNISIDKNGLYLVVTNYSGKSFIVWNLKNYLPTTIHSYIVHEGSSINPDRQSESHPHSSAFSQSNDVLFVADLGTDILYYYDIDPLKVTWRKQKSLKLLGAGPRTLCRGKEGQKILYLSCQLDNTVRILSYSTNTLQHLNFCKVSQNPTNFPSQVRFFTNQVYLANRGDDNIQILTADKPDNFKVVNSYPVKSFPRHFIITPEGVIIVACQKGNAVQTFTVKGKTMLLLRQVQVESPTIVVSL